MPPGTRLRENCGDVEIDTSIFREYDIRGVVGRQLTHDSVSVIAKAMGCWLRRHRAVRVTVGYDARESSPAFHKIVASELIESGCDVVSIGRVPTPVLYHAVYTLGVDAGVMITGSHNPPDHNGFKVCLGKQTLFGDQIQEIKEIALRGVREHGSGSWAEANAVDPYLDDLRGRLYPGGRKLKIVVDAGNGMGGVTAVPLYKALGAEVIELFTEPDPAFPNHAPDPSVEENLSALIASVKLHRADAGFAFDGDADRLAVVDDRGSIWWGDRILTLFARDVLSTNPGGTVIGEVKCSQTLFDDIKAHGGVPLMWKAGHSIIKSKLQETDAALAGEMSGHFFFADRYYGFDDGCYAGARMLEILSKADRPLSTLLADLKPVFSTPEIRIACPEERKMDVAREIGERFSARYDVNTIDGARITFAHGWGIVRPSNTQELLILRFEADTQEHLEAIRGWVESAVIELIG